MKKAVLFISMLAALSGCGSMSGRLGEMPEVGDKTKAAKVVVARVSSVVGAANGYIVALDGKDLLGIGSGEHAEFLLPPGDHYIGVKCFGGFTPTWKENSLKFEATAAKASYFVVSPNLSCAAIKAADEKDVQQLLPGSKLINLEKLVAK